MYENGTGVTKDAAEAARWYQKAADAGYALGMVNLGLLYENGLGVTKDAAEAKRWYRKAADAGRHSAWSISAACTRTALGTLRRPRAGIGKPPTPGRFSACAITAACTRTAFG
jgi:TPR repeat protein